MKHFMQLGQINVLALAHAIQFADDLWQDNEIVLRSNGPEDAWLRLPQVREPIFDLMRMAEGTRLKTVVIERLAPGEGQKITKPEGLIPIRYEIALQNLPGSTLKIGEESVRFEVGAVWVWRLAEPLAERWNGSTDDSVFLNMEIDTA